MRILILLFLLSSFFSVLSKASPCDSLKWSLQLGSNLSYNGTDLNLALGLTQQRHTIHIGPQVNVSDSYFPKRNIGGLVLGYRYAMSVRKRWTSFVHIESQWSFLGTQAIPLDNALEMYAGYGVQYRLNPRFLVSNTLGVGGYLENYTNPIGEKESFSAYAVLIGLSGRFEF